MMTVALGFLSTAFLFWSATVAGERRSAIIGTVGFALLVAAMVAARAGRPADRQFVDPIEHVGPAVCQSSNVAEHT